MAAICRRNGVFVVADEIHCELTYPGHPYTPVSYPHLDVYKSQRPFRAGHGESGAYVPVGAPEAEGGKAASGRDNQYCQGTCGE